MYAGATADVHPRIIEKNFEQYCVPIEGQAEIPTGGRRVPRGEAIGVHPARDDLEPRKGRRLSVPERGISFRDIR